MHTAFSSRFRARDQRPDWCFLGGGFRLERLGINLWLISWVEGQVEREVVGVLGYKGSSETRKLGGQKDRNYTHTRVNKKRLVHFFKGWKVNERAATT